MQEKMGNIVPGTHILTRNEQRVLRPKQSTGIEAVTTIEIGVEIGTTTANEAIVVDLVVVAEVEVEHTAQEEADAVEDIGVITETIYDLSKTTEKILQRNSQAQTQNPQRNNKHIGNFTPSRHPPRLRWLLQQTQSRHPSWPSWVVLL